MKYEARKHQGKGKRMQPDEAGKPRESGKTVQRYRRLARLSDELLDMVDKKKIGLVQGVDISFLSGTGAGMGTGHSGGNRVQHFHPPVSKTEGVWKKGELDLAMVRLILTEEKLKEERSTIKGERISYIYGGGLQ